MNCDTSTECVGVGWGYDQRDITGIIDYHE